MRKNFGLVAFLSFSFLLMLSNFSFGSNSLDNISFSSGNSAQKIMSPDEAFKVQAHRKGSRVSVHIEPATGVYVYKKSISITTINPKNGTKVGQIHFPSAKIKADDQDGSVEVYDSPVDISFNFLKPSHNPITISVALRGCSSAGVCYPPQKYTITLPSPNKVNKTKAQQTDGSDNSDPFFEKLNIRNKLSTLLLFLGLGIMLTFTPCVFPMIPIISSILIGQKKLSKFHSFFLSLAYTMGMCLTYTIVGIVSALSGTLLSAWLQNPFVLFTFATIISALALSLFGAFEIGLPSSLSTKISTLSGRFEDNASMGGTFVMGVLSALIIGPCVAPPLAGTLLYIAKTGNVVLGGTALFMLALGMGIPIVIVGLSADKILPKAGAWMEKIKQICGFSLLGLAVHIVSPVIPQQIASLSYTLLLLACCVWSGFFEVGTTAPIRFIGLICLLLGVHIGSNLSTQCTSNHCEPSLTGGSVTSAERQKLSFNQIESTKQLNRILSHRQLPVLIKITAKWCSSCNKMEKSTFVNPDVVDKLKNFDRFIIDVSENNSSNRKLMKKYEVFGPPAIIIYGNKEESKYKKLIGFQSSDDLLKALKDVKS
ncbi:MULTISPECIES: protein-disulfide reductase DsbD [Candidatus Ichthyocystis]|uniref:Thiol:disulfide interchange protein DsbD n=1 Tax=Candidatus Ichthyocystis hellenicum TaxID=1561003 RepID=A0A0S4M0Z4_9BURK|nr:MULTISPECIES: protein-disulfide reductase DsbD [Ichthyocystis]CUT17461.1 Thiol:disulfide interchange protein DsbD [Candidatus Ichthyocystis hellenicum]